MSPVQRIAIVGAGLSGLAVAVAASAAGLQVELFEASARLAAAPVHIDVGPALVRDLVALGVGDACVRRGFAYRGMAVVDAGGQPHFEIATPALAGPRWPAAMGMVYGDLLRVLHDTALAQGAQLHWHASVARVDAHAASPALETASGMAWRGDLVVLAGAGGVGGVELPLAEGSRRLPQRWDHVLLPRPRGLDASTWVLGPGRNKALLVPVGVAQAGLALLRDEAADASPARLRAQLAAQGSVLAGLAPHLRDDAVVIGRPVHTALLAADWHAGAALRVGASAHVLPPHFGQAAAQSVEDATVLGDLLGQRLPRDELLARFMARRAARAAQVHAITTQAAMWDLQPEAATDLPALARRLAPIVEHAA